MWKIDESSSDVISIINQDGIECAAAMVVRKQDWASKEITRAKALENARLIAAAPDMLAALHMVMAIYDKHAGLSVCYGDVPESETTKAVRAAIAKADAGSAA